MVNLQVQISASSSDLAPFVVPPPHNSTNKPCLWVDFNLSFIALGSSDTILGSHCFEISKPQSSLTCQLKNRIIAKVGIAHFSSQSLAQFSKMLLKPRCSRLFDSPVLLSSPVQKAGEVDDAMCRDLACNSQGRTLTFCVGYSAIHTIKPHPSASLPILKLTLFTTSCQRVWYFRTAVFPRPNTTTTTSCLHS